MKLISAACISVAYSLTVQDALSFLSNDVLARTSFDWHKFTNINSISLRALVPESFHQWLEMQTKCYYALKRAKGPELEERFLQCKMLVSFSTLSLFPNLEKVVNMLGTSDSSEEMVAVFDRIFTVKQDIWFLSELMYLLLNPDVFELSWKQRLVLVTSQVCKYYINDSLSRHSVGVSDSSLFSTVLKIIDQFFVPFRFVCSREGGEDGTPCYEASEFGVELDASHNAFVVSWTNNEGQAKSKAYRVDKLGVRICRLVALLRGCWEDLHVRHRAWTVERLKNVILTVADAADDDRVLHLRILSWYTYKNSVYSLRANMIDDAWSICEFQLGILQMIIMSATEDVNGSNSRRFGGVVWDSRAREWKFVSVDFGNLWYSLVAYPESKFGTYFGYLLALSRYRFERARALRGLTEDFLFSQVASLVRDNVMLNHISRVFYFARYPEISVVNFNVNDVYVIFTALIQTQLFLGLFRAESEQPPIRVIR